MLESTDRETPQPTLALTFEHPHRPRMSDLADVMSDIDEIYWASLGIEDRPDGALPERDETVVFGRLVLDLRVEDIRPGSPHLLLAIPVALGSRSVMTFTRMLGHVFGIPASYRQARAAFWEEELEADEEKQAWLDWKKARNEDRGVSLIDVRVSQPEGDAEQP
jgi:hypothetical protein